MGLEISSLRTASTLGMIEPATIRACVFCCANRRDLTDELIASRQTTVSPTRPTNSPSHPFLDSVGRGDFEDVKAQLLIDPTLARSVHDSKGNYASHVAAFAGQLDMFQFLVDTEPELLWAINEVHITCANKEQHQTNLELKHGC